MPLGAEAAARLDSLCRSPGPIVIGLSGGADSHALLIVASRWARMAGRDVHALVVDHAIRPGSDIDARMAAEMARAQGVPVRIERWASRKPQTGLQAAARNFRLKALATECRRVNASTLLLGHTASDRAETVWMRLIAGAGLRGLAAMPAMAPHPVWPEGEGLHVIRPLIDQTRAGVRHWLHQQGLDWIDDPSNDDERFTRVRSRWSLHSMATAGFRTVRLCRLAEDAEVITAELNRAAARLFVASVQPAPWGGARLDSVALMSASDALIRLILSAAITAVSGHPNPAPRAINAILAGLKRGHAATGGGVALTYWQGAVWLVREPGRRILRTARLQEDTPLVWDGRWQFTASRSGLTIGPLGPDYSDYCDAKRLETLPGLARPTLPALRDGGTVLAVPGLEDPAGIAGKTLFWPLATRHLFAGNPPAWFDRA